METENTRKPGVALQLHKKRTKRRTNLHWLRYNASSHTRPPTNGAFMTLQTVQMPSRRCCGIFNFLRRVLYLFPVILLLLLYIKGFIPPDILAFLWPKHEFHTLTYRYGNSSQASKWKEMPNCTTEAYNQSFLGSEVTRAIIHRPTYLKIYKRNQHIFIPNYVKAEKSFNCEESITFSTHGEFHFMDNLVPIVERWRGPVSMAIYAPGSDFAAAGTRIRYLRECTSELIKELVTFHMYIPLAHLRQTRIDPFLPAYEIFNCSAPPAFFDYGPSYRNKRNLTYPVNVVRNLARTQVNTTYIMAADIELYPSPNLVSMLLDLIDRAKRGQAGKVRFNPSPKTVYVPPLFEIDESVPLPSSKTELLELMEAGKAIVFHAALCSYCHRIPGYKKWLVVSKETDKLQAAHETTRKGWFDWEPVFVGTNADPLFHEELTWEGQRNKMTQAYEMCMMDYRYVILDNAFLVHRPGIKVNSRNKKLKHERSNQQRRIWRIQAALQQKYGNKSECLI